MNIESEKSLMESKENSIVKTLCGMCFLSCKIDVSIKNGKIVKVAARKGEITCLKPKGAIEWIYSKERITTPLKKIGGEWKEISWDEAFTFISEKLKDIKKKYKARSLVVHLGFNALSTHSAKIARRFCDIYGTPNYTTGSSLCFYAKVIGNSLTFNQNGILLEPDLPESNCIVIWGSNPTQSAFKIEAIISKKKKEGAKLIVVDPRRTPLAKKADIHAQLRPGTDCALALGVLNVIIEENLYDKNFVENWCAGFYQLAEHVKKYPPEKVQEITWVSADIIRKFARMYAGIKPASILQGVAIDHCTNGVQSHRAISILMAVTGNFDRKGGNTYIPQSNQADLRLKEKIMPEESIGKDYPIFNKIAGETTSSALTEVIMTKKPYMVKAFIIQGSNPLLTWPNSNRLKDAFKKLDLIVVIDHFMTETARFADIFLPAATFLERDDILTYALVEPILIGRKRAINPLRNSLPDWKIWAELGKKMGYEEYFPWKNEEDLFKTLLEPTGITFEKFKENPDGVFYEKKEELRYLKEGFATPSGKVEIYSNTMEKYGYDPLPTYKEPAESPISRKDLAKEYPLIITTGARVNVFTHSQYRQVASLRKHMPEPILEINPQTAERFGIKEKEKVKVESPRGAIKIKAKLTSEILPGVINISHGWEEANVNILIDDEAHDPISGYPGFRSSLCKVTPI